MDSIFATITPTNVLAKMAFSDVFDITVNGQQKDSKDPALQRMKIQPNQEYHADVLHYRLEMERKLSEGDISESLTELDTDNELESRHLGIIWQGHYVVEFQRSPSAPELGWIIGKKSSSADIVLCGAAFAKRHSLNIRSSHARLNFDSENGALFISSVSNSPSVELAVNGLMVKRQMHTLNQHKMKIRVSLLEYDFEYTHFASTDNYMENRKKYLKGSLKAIPALFNMPTPQLNTKTIGQWTLNKPLGKGSAGKVFLASNSKNDVVAVKVIEHTFRSAKMVDTEIAQYQALTTLAQKRDDNGRLIHVREIIDPREELSSLGSSFNDIALILEPMVPLVLEDLIGMKSMGYVNQTYLGYTLIFLVN